jgi:CheY-like chemotaxis protein
MALQDSPKIFVVDDESVIANTVAILLKRRDFTATAFTNPIEALERAHIDPPDLLVSDVMMPEMSGVELAIQLKRLTPRLQDPTLFRPRSYGGLASVRQDRRP